MEVMLEVKNLSKNFRLRENQTDNFKQFITNFLKEKRSDDFHALQNISFHLHEGEALGIIGKNGAGKSTLLRVLSGISSPDEGEINFYGKVVSILDIGAGFHPELSGLENIYLSGALYGFSKNEIDARYQQIVEFSDIADFINEPVKNYSSGMYLRLAFSIITCIDADIYLIDEVINVGDANFQNKCKSRMEELIAAGKTMVIASHNLNEIVSLCNRIILMEEGKIIREGGNEIIQQYITRALPQYFSFDDGNFFHVKNLEENFTTKELSIEKCGLENAQIIESGINGNLPFSIYFEVNVKEISELILRLKIHDSTGVLVFVCSSLNHSNEMRERGKYRVEFTMPANIFNSRMYWADLSVIDNTMQTICGKADKCVTFKIADDTALSETEQINFLPGIVKPKVETKITKL